MITRILTLMGSVCLIGLMFTIPALAQDTEQRSISIAVGVNGGTTGLGGEVTTSLSPKFNARVGFNALSYSNSGSYNDADPGLDYTADLNNKNFSALVDFFPTKRWFKLTVGGYYYNFQVTGTGQANESYTLNEGKTNEKTFSADRLGNLGVELTYPNAFMPFAGLGLGNPVAANGKLKLNFQVGVLYSGTPEITMSGEGLISGTTDHASSFQEGLNEFKWHPVLNLGLSFKLR